MDVDDPAGERFELRARVNAVVARVDEELDAVREKEVAHRLIPLFRRVEGFLLQLTERDAAFARENRGPARRPVRGDGDDVEPLRHEVA